MIDYKYSDLFLKDGVDKQFHIVSDDETIHITNSELHFEQLELTESLCSQSQLKFGSCESSILKFKISNVFFSMIGKWLDVTAVLNKNADKPFKFGRYKVASDVPTADRRYRDVTAYDALYDVINAEVSSWYNGLKFPITLKVFRNSFFNYIGIQQEDVELVNDNMIVKETISPSELSGLNVLSSICEINGCFGRIGRDGKFHYVFLNPITKGLYPSNDLYPANDLFPSEENSAAIGNSKYTSCKYEDYQTALIDKVQIRQSENDIGSIVGNGTNAYVVEDNFLVYGMEDDELRVVAENLFGKINKITLRPANIEAIGNPCLEPGDSITLHTKERVVTTYILARTIKGIQSLKDSYKSESSEYQEEKVNSVNKKILQLRGKTNTLERTVEKTILEIKDIESGLSSRITQNADSISAEVKRAQGQEVELAAAISINAENITSKVSKGSVSSEISQEAGKISIKANRFSLESSNCTISEDGSILAKNIQIQGGSVNIVSSSQSYDVIRLRNSAGGYCGMDSFGIMMNRSGKITNIMATGSTFGGVVKIDTLNTDNIAGSNTSSTIDFSNSVKFLKSVTLEAGSIHTVKGTFQCDSFFYAKGTNGNNFESSSSYAKMGASLGYVGFFGSDGARKKSVSTLSTSATITTCVSKVNEIINALKSYNLI